MTGPPAPTYCGRCGELLTARDHAACLRHLDLEPPRYCAVCRRRMVVQVAPDRWSARCAEHGQSAASTWKSLPVADDLG